MSVVTFGGLDSNSVLAELPGYDACVSSTIEARQIAAMLEADGALPGIIVTDVGGTRIEGVLSRTAFLKGMNRPFGREVFLRRPVTEMLRIANNPYLLFSAATAIHEAARLGLEREKAQRYEPVVMERQAGQWTLLDMGSLLQAQSEILAKQMDAHRIAVETARQAEKKYRGIFDNAIEGIFQLTADGHYLSVNPALARLYGFASPEAMLTLVRDHPQELHLDLAGRTEFLHQAAATDQIMARESQVRRQDGVIIWVSIQARAIRDEAGNLLYIEGSLADVTARKQAEQERERLQEQLLEASREAGMAEVATGVLHNVGNVLNSVAVSAALITNQVKSSKTGNLGKATALLEAHRAELGAYLSSDEKGKVLPGYLIKLASSLAGEQATMLQEIAALTRSVDHIKEIVGAQQNFAKVSAVMQRVDLAEALEEAVRINAVSFERHRIQVERAYHEVPPITADKHRIMQILINLVSNAKKAVRDSTNEPRQVRLAVEAVESDGHQVVRVSVSDNGVGVAADNLTRIFNHGFTTRTDGHGFGLHNAALAAKQMGGAVRVTSPGAGRGATFILELPLEPALPAAGEK